MVLKFAVVIFFYAYFRENSIYLKMAKLHNYYVLCPLIDQKSFLGVSPDQDNENVIVTLGRNVVHKYRLSDQKQIGGWTSKDHITSAVIYDAEGDNYVGVFNKNTIKIWNDDSANLDKIKKYKFSINILKLIPRSDQSPLVIFTNGNCAALPYALENRKTYESKSLIKDTDTIVDVSCFLVNKTDHICYVIKNSKDHYEIVTCPLRDELSDMDRSKFNKIKVTRSDDVSVVGKLIVPEISTVFILWSDSKISSYDIIKQNWKSIGAVPWVSTLSSASLSWMGSNHLIIFGHNIDQDGAIIVAYNIILGVGSCRYPMKMYTEDAKLYCFNNRIILQASNHIGILPYVLETKRNLSKLLGSHDIIQEDCTEIADWDTPTTPQFEINEEIKELLKLGLTERNICAQIIPPMLEKEDTTKVFETMLQFEDIPESIIVMVLKYVLKLLKADKVDIKNIEEIAKICNGDDPKVELLHYIFAISFSDVLLIPHLRNVLSLDDTLFLMIYLPYLIYESNRIIYNDYETRLVDWVILLMDAFYQQYLVTKDEKVTYVLENVMDVVVNLLKQLHAVDSVMPLLNKILSGKSTESNDDTLPYSIELMKI